MSQDDGGFGIRLNIRDDDDFSTPLNIPPDIQNDGYVNAAGYSDTFANKPYVEDSDENNYDEYGYGDYGENYRNYIDHPRDFTARNTFFLIGGLLLFGLAVFLLSVSPRLSMRMIFWPSLSMRLTFQWCRLKGRRMNEYR